MIKTAAIRERDALPLPKESMATMLFQDDYVSAQSDSRGVNVNSHFDEAEPKVEFVEASQQPYANANAGHPGDRQMYDTELSVKDLMEGEKTHSSPKSPDEQFCNGVEDMALGASTRAIAPIDPVDLFDESFLQNSRKFDEFLLNHSTEQMMESDEWKLEESDLEPIANWEDEKIDPEVIFNESFLESSKKFEEFQNRSKLRMGMQPVLRENSQKFDEFLLNHQNKEKNVDREELQPEGAARPAPERVNSGKSDMSINPASVFDDSFFQNSQKLDDFIFHHSKEKMGMQVTREKSLKFGDLEPCKEGMQVTREKSLRFDELQRSKQKLSSRYLSLENSQKFDEFLLNHSTQNAMMDSVRECNDEELELDELQKVEAAARHYRQPERVLQGNKRRRGSYGPSTETIAEEGSSADGNPRKMVRRGSLGSHGPPAPFDPAAIVARLNAIMRKSAQSQKALQQWDKKAGLPRSHCQTMVNSARSRKQLQEGVILAKWDGTPLIDNNLELGKPKPRKSKVTPTKAQPTDMKRRESGPW